MNNFIHRKSGRMNEYKDKQTNNKTNTIKYVYQQKHNSQPCIRKCLQTELSIELYEAKNLVFNLLNRTLGNSDLYIFSRYFTISILVVLNNFIKIFIYNEV